MSDLSERGLCNGQTFRAAGRWPAETISESVVLSMRKATTMMALFVGAHIVEIISKSCVRELCSGDTFTVHATPLLQHSGFAYSTIYR